jgi:uncharacterized membrane protein
MSTAEPRADFGRAVTRWALAVLYLVAAGFHFAKPRPFLSITPGWVPWPETVIWLTGAAEAAGALALLQPWSRRLRQAGGIGLALYAVCVYPANVNHMLLDLAKPSQGLGLGYHVPRLLAQPVIVWLALWAGEVTAWPFARKGARA